MVKWSMTRREYVDKRDWIEYNEKLVRRGELYFSFEFLDSWSKDLAQANEGKVGRRYEFPEPYIQHLYNDVTCYYYSSKCPLH